VALSLASTWCSEAGALPEKSRFGSDSESGPFPHSYHRRCETILIPRYSVQVQFVPDAPEFVVAGVVLGDSDAALFLLPPWPLLLHPPSSDRVQIDPAVDRRRCRSRCPRDRPMIVKEAPFPLKAPQRPPQIVKMQISQPARSRISSSPFRLDEGPLLLLDGR